MPPTSNPKRTIEDVHNDLDALRVFVAALAEVADQSRLKQAAEEHKSEHIERLASIGATEGEIGGFIKSFKRLEDAY